MATPSQIELEARQTVLDQIVAGASFTGYEITLEVRRRLGSTVDVPHSIVNGVVQTMFSNGEIIGYDRAPDTSVKAATPPFRYAPKAASPRGSAPVAPAAVIGVNRKSLPINLRYSNPVAAVVREYALEARSFHDAVGKGDTPFDVFLPTAQNPTFRVRSFGAVPTESQIEARYGLSAASVSDFGSKAAYAYADEFRVSTFQNGVAKTFRCALDATGQGIVAKDGEVPTSQADGVEIEVLVNASLLQSNFVGHEAARIFAFFRVPPRVQSGALPPFSKRGEILFQAQNWRVTRGVSYAVAGDVAWAINTTLPLAGVFSRSSASVGIELFFAPGELETSEEGESLLYSDQTRDVLKAGFERVEREMPPLLQNHVASAPTIWEARLRFSLLQSDMGTLLGRFQTRFEWRGLEIQSALFDQFDATEVTVSGITRRADGRLKTERNSVLAAQENAVVFFNDLDTRTGSPARLREFFAANPTVQRASVLTFSSDAAREHFIAQNQFETVPTLLLSLLPKPAASAPKAKRQSKRAPFDSNKHQVLAPQNPLVAAFASLDDARWVQLERWARETPLDGANWPDWKRLWKQLEARLWPIQTRGRWQKTESDVPADAPLASEREAWLLGLMIGRLDSTSGPHSATRTAPDNSLLARLKAVFRLSSSSQKGPSAETVAYLVRRAEKLCRFLHDGRELQAARRALLVPLLAGSLARLDCSSIRQTLAFRLNIADEVLGNRADWVGRIWNDADLAVPVLKWAFEWLRARDEPAQGTVHHVRRLAGAGEAELVLALLPALLQNGAPWPRDYGLKRLSTDLQSAPFSSRRGEVLRLFARFPGLQAADVWILNALDTPEANTPEVVALVTPLLEAQAKAGQFALVSRLAAQPLKVFLDALVAANPQGLGLKEWKSIGTDNLIEALAPALIAMPMSREIADFLWFNPYLQDQFIRMGGEALWIEALAPMIQDNAQKENFGCALVLPPLGRALFFQTLSSNLSISTWQKLAALDADALKLFALDIARLPLSDAFWAFVSEDEQTGARWLELVGRERAATEFLQLSASAVQGFLESGAGALTPLIESWLVTHANTLSNDEPLLLSAATHLNDAFRAPAFARLRAFPMNLRVALRLMESGLPGAMSLARPFFELDSDEWAARVLALADSPKAATRAFALDLLARFPTRWTSDLLRQLAQHDDARVQAFVAARLNQAPQSETVAAFQNAILNGRGRARRAKIAVQRDASAPSIPVLLDAARSGSPHDRAWALQQLVKAQLNGVDVPGLEVGGAFGSK